MPKYRVLRGLSYPPGKRAEPGDVVSDIPEGSVPGLLRRRAIEPVVNVTRNPYPPTSPRKEG